MNSKSQHLTRDVFFRSDIENALVALKSVNDSFMSELQVEDMSVYKAGFDAAIGAMARAFSVYLENSTIAPPVQANANYYPGRQENYVSLEGSTYASRGQQRIVRTYGE